MSYSLDKYSEILKEIGERKPPLKKNFHFTKTDLDYHTTFRDDDDDTVDVKFELYANKSYNVVFAYGEEDKKQKDTTVSNLLNILSTVTQAILEFIEKINPNKLKIKGAGEDEEQAKKKDRLYFAYVEKNLDSSKWFFNKKDDELLITKKDPELKEKHERLLKEYSEFSDRKMKEEYDKFR